jgi:AraC-like DNA-binding protein
MATLPPTVAERLILPRTATFSTATIPASQRLPYLVDYFAREMFRVDWRPLSDEAPQPFRAAVRIVAAENGVSTIDYVCSGGIAERSRASASREEEDALILYREREHTNLFITPDGSEYKTRRQGLLIYPTDMPITSVQAAGQDTSFVGVRLPMKLIASVTSLKARPRIGLLDSEGPFVRIVSDFIASWSQHHGLLAAPEGEAATTTLIHLLSVFLGADTREPSLRVSMGAARLQAAVTIIARNLHRPELTPDLIARQFGISTRQLHLDFEPTGVSVSRRILEMRLDLAARQLREDPNRSIADIAFSCGFDGLSTFYRVFKARYGMTATEWRAVALLDGGA